MRSRTSESHPLKIAEVPAGAGVIGVTLCPGKKGESWSGFRWQRDLQADLKVIRAWGATAMATLIEPREFRDLAVEALPGAAAAAGIEWHHLPITDVSPPDRRFDLRWHYAWPRLHAHVGSGGRVLVHCKGGLGRAGTVAAHLLVALGESPHSAIRRVREARPGAIETTAQEVWITSRPNALPTSDSLRTRQLACLLGGAIGDALGYRIEFDPWPRIEAKYGPAGITLSQATGPLIVSDDTQMSLFTLEGMARGLSSGDPIEAIRLAYLDWLVTQQGGRSGRDPVGTLATWKELHKRMAPGNTCLSALQAGGRGTARQPINDSKGCGGVMRTAPIGFLPADFDDAQVFELGAAAGALTHGHPEGYLPSGAMALLVRYALQGLSWPDAIRKTLIVLADRPESKVTSSAITSAVELASTGAPSLSRIEQIGGGWVGEEALAIGLYAAMTADSFAKCLEIASNHSGDSDSTASIAGQLFGAKFGLDVLPSEAVYRLDVLEPLQSVYADWEQAHRASHR